MSNLDNELKMLRNNQLKKDDISDFKCKACGKCCRRHDDIILTPYDLYEIAAKLEISVEKVVYDYCDRFDDDKLVYFSQPVSCGEHNPTQTVADWLERNGVTEENEWFTVEWYELMSKLTIFIHECKFSSSELEAFQRALVPILYLCYRTDGYFYEQFLDRYECLERIMREI